MVVNEHNEPQFPLRGLFYENETLVEEEIVDSVEDLVMQWEYLDSEDCPDGELMVVVDACGRRVHVRTENMKVKILELYPDPAGIDAEE